MLQGRAVLLLRRSAKLLTATYNSMSRCCFRKDESAGDATGGGIPQAVSGVQDLSSGVRLQGVEADLRA
jgi:hypothetical protein